MAVLRSSKTSQITVPECHLPCVSRMGPSYAAVSLSRPWFCLILPKSQKDRSDAGSSGFHRSPGHFPRRTPRAPLQRSRGDAKGRNSGGRRAPKAGLVIRDLVARAGQWEREK